MMENFNIADTVNVLSWIFLGLGSFFVVVGGLGLLRMPDMFTRMHATSVIDTVGAGFIILGLIVQAGVTLVTVKLIFILLLIGITSPVASHALAQAALHEGLEPLLDEDRREARAAILAAKADEAATADGAKAAGDQQAGAQAPGRQS